MARIKTEEGSVPNASEEFFTAGGTALYMKLQNGGFVNLETGMFFATSSGGIQPVPVGYKFTVEVDK